VRYGNQRDVIRSQAHDQEDESYFTLGCVEVWIEMISSPCFVGALDLQVADEAKKFSLGRWDCAQVGESVQEAGIVWCESSIMNSFEEDCVDGAEG
jgi:hypothetical protein